jgi:hypothetical protein
MHAQQLQKMRAKQRCRLKIKINEADGQCHESQVWARCKGPQKRARSCGSGAGGRKSLAAVRMLQKCTRPVWRGQVCE